MADKLHKAKMKIKWIGAYKIVEVTAVERYKLRDTHRHVVKSHFPLPVKWYYQEMPGAADNEDPYPLQKSVHM